MRGSPLGGGDVAYLKCYTIIFWLIINPIMGHVGKRATGHPKHVGVVQCNYPDPLGIKPSYPPFSILHFTVVPHVIFFMRRCTIVLLTIVHPNSNASHIVITRYGASTNATLHSSLHTTDTVYSVIG